MSTENDVTRERSHRHRQQPERLLPNETDACTAPKQATKPKKAKTKKAKAKPALQRTRSLPTTPARAGASPPPLRRSGLGGKLLPDELPERA